MEEEQDTIKKKEKLTISIRRARDGGYALYDDNDALIHAASTLHETVSHVLVVAKSAYEPLKDEPLRKATLQPMQSSPPHWTTEESSVKTIPKSHYATKAVSQSETSPSPSPSPPPSQFTHDTLTDEIELELDPRERTAGIAKRFSKQEKPPSLMRGLVDQLGMMRKQ